MTENQGGSCEPCKRKKCKCDRQLPSCGQCDTSKLSCTYSEGNKRGIPTGYLGLLEQRLGETETLLYCALTTLRALKLQDTFSSITGSENFSIPDPIPREMNTSKQDRMEEWREYPLQTADEVERWRNFLGGGVEVPVAYGGHPGFLTRPQHAGYQDPPNQQFDHPGPSLVYHDQDMDTNIATGLMDLSQSQNRIHIQHPQSSTAHHSPGHPPTQVLAISNPPAFSSPSPMQQMQNHPSSTDNYAADFSPHPSQEMTGANANPNPELGDSGHGGGWETSSSGPGLDRERQSAISQNPTGLVKSQQLSAAFRNVYY